MGLLHGTRRALIGGRREYYEIVLDTSPIAYWPQWEPSGTISRDLVLAAQDGAYTGVTLGQPGIGDGRTSPFFDGANDFNNIFTATFQGRFNGSEGTVMAWARVANAGVWTDGIWRSMLWIKNNAAPQDLVHVTKRNTANTFEIVYRANAVTEIVAVVTTTADWFQVGTTWSASTGATGEMRAYFNGVQTGATQVALGAWGVPITGAVIGAIDLVPTTVWHGYIAHPAVWGRPLPPAEILHLYEAGVF